MSIFGYPRERPGTDDPFVTWETSSDLTNQEVLVAGSNILLIPGANSLTINASGAGNPIASYVTMLTEPSLPNDRTLVNGSGLTLTDGGPGGNATLGISSTITGASFLTTNTEAALPGSYKIYAGTGVNFVEGSNFLIIQSTGGGGGAGSGSVTSFSSGNLTPLFTASVANPTSTPALSFTLSNAASGTLYGVSGSTSAPPGFIAPGTADQVTSINHTGNGIEYKSILGTANQITTTPAAGSITISIPSSPAIPGSPTTTTQASSDNSTKVATTAYVTTAVANAIAGVDPAVAVQAATNAILPNSPTYLNGVSGVGATITAGVTNTPLVVDSYSVNTNDGVLVKNEASGGGLGAGKNGIYTLTTPASLGVAWILTRATDYNQPSDINNTGAIPVVNGTANTDTTWVLTSAITAVDGSQALTYTQFSLNPTTIVTGAGNLSPIFTTTTGANTISFTLSNASQYNFLGYTGAGSGTPSYQQIAFTALSGSATLGQLPGIANNTVLGSITAGTNAPVALTATQLTTLVNTFTSSLSGAVPASSGGTTTFLRADGTFATPPGGGGGGTSLGLTYCISVGTIPF